MLLNPILPIKIIFQQQKKCNVHKMIVPLSFSKSDYVGLGLVVWFIQILDRDKIKTDGRIIIYTRTPEYLSLPILRWCDMALISIKHIVFTVLIFFQLEKWNYKKNKLNRLSLLTSVLYRYKCRLVQLRLPIMIYYTYTPSTCNTRSKFCLLLRSLNG